MIEIDRALAYVTRRATGVRGAGRISARLIRWLRPRFARAYGSREDRFVEIGDYDGTIKMRLDRASYMGGMIYWAGYHHRWELRYLARVLGRTAVFVDIGANQGEFSLFAAKRCAQVIAFEPERSVRDLLIHNVRANAFENVRVFEFGLADREESRALYTSDDLATHGGLHEGLFTAYPTESRSRFVQEFSVRRLDDILVGDNVGRVDLIKIDIEGGELSALRGAHAILRRDRPRLIVEVAPETFRAAGYSSETLCEFLESLGYALFRFGPRGDLVQWTPSDLDPPSLNVVAEPRCTS